MTSEIEITAKMLDVGLTAMAQWWDEFTYGPWPPDKTLIISVYTEMERARIGEENQLPL